MDSIASLISTLFAVFCVLYCTYLFSKFLATGTNKINKAKNMEICERITLGQDRYMAIAKIVDKFYLISVTSNEVSILKELEDFKYESVDGFSDKLMKNDFKNILSSVIKKRK